MTRVLAVQERANGTSWSTVVLYAGAGLRARENQWHKVVYNRLSHVLYAGPGLREGESQ